MRSKPVAAVLFFLIGGIMFAGLDWFLTSGINNWGGIAGAAAAAAVVGWFSVGRPERGKTPLE